MDSNRPLPLWGRIYVGVVAGTGAAMIGRCVFLLIAHPIGWNWFVLAALTLLSGSATVALPAVPATISISETFVFTSVLLYGPSAGTLTATLDVLAISLWLARKGHPLYRLAFNVFGLPLGLWLAAQVFFGVSHIGPLALSAVNVSASALLLPLALFTFTYFFLNSWLIAIAISLEKETPAFAIWKNNFAWLSLNYFGGASVAAFLVTYIRNFDFAYLALVLPLLAVLYFTFSTAMGRVKDANRHLSELNSLYMSTIETLAMAIDAKDQITHGHIRRVQQYAVGLAKAMGVVDPEQISAIEAASLLHDTGKLAVPEYILNKPGPLTDAEFARMKMHAAVGADILSAVRFPFPVVPIVRHHHENWDGTGYPDGLSGADIPIGARILSVADCFDALTSDRPYRPKLADAEALKILRDRRGSMYDPLVVDTFERVYRTIAPTESPQSLISSLSAITESGTGSQHESAQAARLDQISASTDEMLTLFDLAKALSPTMSVHDIGDLIAKHLRRLIPSSMCVFYLYDDRTDELEAFHVTGDNASLVTGLRIQRGQRLSGWVAANRQTIRNSDPVLDFGESARSMTPRPRSCMSTPLSILGELVGVLSVYSGNREGFTADHQRVLEIVTRQVAPVIKHASDANSVRARSMKDQLTGLPNTQQLAEFTKSASPAADTSPASLLLIDIDDLKVINSRLGRDEGDAALELVANASRRCLRPSDVLFRYVADQFVAVLLQTPENVARGLADNIKRAVATTPLPGGTRISVSIAVASAPNDGDDFEGLLRAAERQIGSARRDPDRGPSTPRIH